MADLIRAHIRERGPQPFAWFMEQALYHPEHGYYSSGRAVIGRRGDYFTNISVGPLFGRLLARQFIEIWERLGRIDNFTLAEQGAHDGTFARDVLTCIQTTAPEFFSVLRYRITEPFPIWRDRQAQVLQDFHDKVEWNKSDPFTGIHFSNELLDAMPANLSYKLVGLNGDDLVFIEGKPSSKEGSAVENWIDTTAAQLQRGFVVAIDYGFVRDEFREVVQARAEHRHLDSPFEMIGEADITAHINWTDLAERAEANGLRIAGFTDQHHFLTGIISEWPNLAESATDKRALQTLLHPEMLGRAFQVLALSKDVDPAVALAGFKFGSNARHHLGL